MTIYDDMRTVATELFAEFKQGTIEYVPVVTVAGAAPDESDSSGPGTPVALNATARPVSTKYVDGTHIVQSDIQVAIPNDGRATPDITGFIQIDSVRYKIIEIMARPAAGTPITWTVIVRR